MKKFVRKLGNLARQWFEKQSVLSFIILFFGLFTSAKAQFLYDPVYANLTGEILRAKLAETYKPTVFLDYGVARDTLFSKVHAVHDTLYCVYTNLGIYIPPGTDPTQAVYLNGIANGINTEHVFPESKGASGVAKSDMHNLFPSKNKVNSDRADKQFRNIPDQETKRWYHLAEELSTMPSATVRDNYSESNNDFFEPRESVKGDLARAIFYFYTMYTENALTEDIHFFEDQMNVLCEWHNSDPVDAAEWHRNITIAKYQGNLNPFILDCSLVSRAYCNNIDQRCEAIVPTQDITAENPKIKISYWNGILSLYSEQDITGNVTIFDAMGRNIFSNSIPQSQEFTTQLKLIQGLSIAVVRDNKGQIITSQKLFIP